MRRNILILVILMCIVGCSKKSTVDDIKSEYIIYAAKPEYSQKEQYAIRSYNYFQNQLISQEKIDKANSIVNLYPAYYLYAFGHNQRLENDDWQIMVDNQLLTNKENYDQLPVRKYLNYFAMVPYLEEATITPYITHRFTGTIKDNAIPVYISSHMLDAFDLQIDTNYNNSIEWNLSTFIPVDMNVEGYELKEEEVVLQVIGFVETYGTSSPQYFYMSYEKMMSIIEKNHLGEVKPYTYIAMMNESEKRKLINKYSDWIIIKRTDDQTLPDGRVKGLHEE